ncbi:MAG: Nicotianamine synthase [Benjaminiella poitrasii]|nr:MAG: Nicotianamine synthase [Benjaminiella poitrasii]
MVHHLTFPQQETELVYHHHNLQKANNSCSIASSLVDEIRHVYHQLSKIDVLMPSNHVNTLFTKLVTICTLQYDTETVKTVLKDTYIASLIPNLRILASQGEYFLELTWAKEFVRQKQSKPELSQFIYYQNYVDLVQLELYALRSINARLKHLVFIGSGPLPLSSILMYQKLYSIPLDTNDTTPLTVHNIDRDQDSINISGTLLKRLGIDHGVQQHLMDAIEYPGFCHSDVVILGALVGQDAQEKMLFLTNIGKQMKQGSIVMVRSSHSLRKLLYPSIEPYQVKLCGFETMIVLHPFNDVVNSILIARKV